jgi:hypothetical protein
MESEEMRVRFTGEFEWRPQWGVVIVYPEGLEYTVPRACGEAAIEAGKAEMVRAQKGK